MLAALWRWEGWEGVNEFVSVIRVSQTQTSRLHKYILLLNSIHLLRTAHIVARRALLLLMATFQDHTVQRRHLMEQLQISHADLDNQASLRIQLVQRDLIHHHVDHQPALEMSILYDLNPKRIGQGVVP